MSRTSSQRQRIAAWRTCSTSPIWLRFSSRLPWLLYQRLRHGKYREGWDAKFWGRVPERTRR